MCVCAVVTSTLLTDVEVFWCEADVLLGLCPEGGSDISEDTEGDLAGRDASGGICVGNVTCRGKTVTSKRCEEAAGSQP